MSVVIPVLDEEATIRDCVGSALAQTYPEDRVEVIVADGGSADRTREIVRALAARHSNLRLVDNPGRSPAAGLNRAIAVARGDVVARLDGHAAWPAHHLHRCIEMLERTGADNVGGGMAPAGETPVAAAVGLATSTRLGVGGAWFHYAAHERDVDTVYLGCFRRSALDRVGPFDEELTVHEDYELNHRIRASGGRIVYSPLIPTRYRPRSDWRALARQYYRYGRGKARAARRAPGVLRPHHLAPPLLALSLLAAAPALLRPGGRRAVALGASVYAATCAIVGARAARRAPAPVRVRVPFVYPVIHLSWGAGFLTGLGSAVAAPGRGAGHRGAS